MNPSSGEPPADTPAASVPPFRTRHLARVVFTTFLLTFIASRLLVILIMGRMIPDFFLHMGQTHVHHLNYGIFLLCTVAGLLLFFQVSEKERWWCAVAYGFSLALTFDEFGMWLHLGGGYWQRASFDAVIVVASLFGMIAFAPRLDRMRAHHWITGAVTVVATVAFYVMLFKSLDYAGKKVGPRLDRLEEQGPQ
jgi:Ca2+/Na+ antiporter